MKVKSILLILYFTICLATILFEIRNQSMLVVHAKLFIIPIISIYYLVVCNYKIKFIKGLILCFCFIGQNFVILFPNDSAIGSLLGFLLANLLLLFLVFQEFKKLRLKKTDMIPILISLLLICLTCITVMSLEYEKIKIDFSLYNLYAIILSTLCFFTVNYYIKKGSYAFFNLVLMISCFVFSDIFFMLNYFYLKIPVFSLIAVITQVLSYFFMINYFIESDKYH